MISKKASGPMDDSVIMIYRVFFLVFVVFVLHGISSLSYDYQVNLYDLDSMIFSRTITDCVASNGIFDIEILNEDIFEYCGLDESHKEDFFVIIDVISQDSSWNFKYGNYNLEWINNIYVNNMTSQEIEVYRPGYFVNEFEALASSNGKVFDSKIKIGVVFQDDF